MQSGTLLLYLKVHGVIKICAGEIVQHIMVYIFISILLKGSVTDFLVLESKSSYIMDHIEPSFIQSGPDQ